MGIPAVALNHFITDLNRPNQTQAEVLESEIGSLKWKKIGFDVLEKISYVAILAITATILAVSYSSVVLTGGLPILFVAATFSTLAISFYLPTVVTKTRQFTNLVDVETSVLAELKKIEHWKGAEIAQFLRDHQIAPEHIPLDLLRPLNPAEPLSALLPLIARFNMLKARSLAIEASMVNSREKLEATLQKKEAETKVSTSPELKEKLRFEEENTRYQKRELYSVPPAIKAAVVLQLLQTPQEVAIHFEALDREIVGVGIISPKKYHMRLFGRNDVTRNDDYFYFHPALNRAPIQLQAIENNMDPRAIRALLFPNAVRV